MKMKHTLAAISAALTFSGAPAHAIDVGPGDYTILPSGTRLAMFYWQHLSAGSLRVNGSDVPGSKFKGDVAILRSLNYFTIGQMPAAFHVVVPFAHIGTTTIANARQQTRNGLGDTTLGLTLWPVQPDNPVTGTTLGLSLFATLPTGGYDPAKIGIGEGTLTLTPQIGLTQGLGGGFYFDGVVDVAFQADHTESGVTYARSPSMQLQAMLRKQWGQTTSLALGYSGERGGAQKIGGIKSGLKTERDQIRLYGTHFITPTTQIQSMIAKDINVEGGFKYDNVVQLRLVKVF